MHSFFNLTSYLLLNASIAIGYVVSRCILNLAYFKHNMQQKQRLQYARYSFFIVLGLFVFIPYIVQLIPTQYHANFQLEPLLKSASNNFFAHHHLMKEQIIKIEHQRNNISLHTCLVFLFLLVITIFFINYIKNILSLAKLYRQSYCRHHFKNIHILFNSKTQLPFCWSFFKKHFIIIPDSMLENPKDLRLALRHEAQHIRQGDTYWLHFLMQLKCICFWNPFINSWIRWLHSLQEFSCDEFIIIKKKISPIDYAQCLINVANHTFNKTNIPHATLAMQNLPKSILYRRITMLFNYQRNQMKKLSVIIAYFSLFFIAISVAFALSGQTGMEILSKQQIASLIQESHIAKSFQITAAPEVVAEINNIRNSKQARSMMRNSLKRMSKYLPIIQRELRKKSLPDDLVVVPLVESGYQPLEESRNPVLAAGIWQIIPETAKRFGLVIDDSRDDRLDTERSTQAALTYLNANYQQFHDWKLAFVAYEIGENNTERLIKKTGSHEAWTLARSLHAPKGLKDSLARFDAALIIMRNPALLD